MSSPHLLTQNTLSKQEQKFGGEKVELIKLLQRHGVIVRGGPEAGEQFINALLVGCGRLGNVPLTLCSFITLWLCTGAGVCFTCPLMSLSHLSCLGLGGR